MACLQQDSWNKYSNGIICVNMYGMPWYIEVWYAMAEAVLQVEDSVQCIFLVNIIWLY